MVQKKFKRSDFAKYSKLGVRRKNKQKYRKGKGLDNKMRLNMKGHLRKVKSGFRTPKKTRNLIKKLKPVQVFNVADLKKVKEGMVGIISKVGDKKRKEILDYAVKNNIKINLNIAKTLAKIEEKLEKSKKIKEERKAKKIARDKKAQKEAEKKAKEEAKKESKDEKTEESISKSKNLEASKNAKQSPVTKTENKSKETKKDTLTNNYGRGK